MFAPTGQPAARKDTLTNVRETEVFTVNIVDFSLVEQMNSTAGSYPEDVDEFEVAGLTVREAQSIDAPIVDEAPASFECRLMKIVEIGDGAMASSVVFGEVVAFDVTDRILEGTRVDQEALDAVGRHVGSYYSRANQMFTVDRPE